jgi:segregation and condensation protein A
MSAILRRLREGGCLFHQLFRPEQGVALVVVNFIALLELAKEGLVRITQAEGFAEIEIHSQDGGAAWPLSDGTEAETESHPI